jgi:hypothetical protein
MDALAKWARRATRRQAPPGPEARESPRRPIDGEVVLLPLDAHSMVPQLHRKVLSAAKDRSDRGLGVVCNAPLDDELYFAQIRKAGVCEEILLVRKVRSRTIRGAVQEHGFMVLDRFDSFDQLYGKL